MRTCPKCGEQIEDQFDSCWKCAIVPVVQGAFADSFGIQVAFFLPVLCYLYIAFYGVKGHIPVRRTPAGV